MRSLIYYDSISSIVPDEYFYNPEENYEPFMLNLVRENLVRPLNPMDSLERPWALTDPFMAFIQRTGKMISHRRSLFQRQNVKFRPRENTTNFSRINSQKFNSDLLYQLEQLGLARRTEGNWYEVESMTAGNLMSYLSNILAQKLDLLSATDLSFNEKSGIFLKRTINIEVNSRRKKALVGVIPYPMELDLSKLAKLKDKHGNLLTHFRSIVEQIALDSRYDDDALLDEKIIELNFHKEELCAQISESKFGPVLFGTVFGISGAVYGYAQTNSWAGLIGGFPGFANAVYSALQQEDPLRTYDGSGMKYLSILESKARRNQNL